MRFLLQLQSLSRRMVQVATVMLGALMLTACPQKTAVWIPGGSSIGSLVLRFGPERGRDGDVALDVVRIYKCADSAGVGGAAADRGAMWVLYAADRGQMVSSLRYGETPVGFRSAVGPVPLAPGCYIAQISGTGRTRFRVGSNGGVSDEGPPW
jgi:hypothetical protein